MTRREREILKASVSWTDKVLTVKEEKAFQAGARWADKTMIERACEWLKHQEEIIGVSSEEDFIERFKEAMEK
jgi:hypothetical protein